jgi:hypothetical protein
MALNIGVAHGNRPRLDRTPWPLLTPNVLTWLGIADDEEKDGLFSLDVSLAALEFIALRIKRWKLNGTASSASYSSTALTETYLPLIRNPYPNDPANTVDPMTSGTNPLVPATAERDIFGPAYEPLFEFEPPWSLSPIIKTLRNQGFVIPRDAPDQPDGIELFGGSHALSANLGFSMFALWYPASGPRTPTDDSYMIPGVLYDAETRLVSIPCAMGISIDGNSLGALRSGKSTFEDEHDVAGHVTVRIGGDFPDYTVPLITFDTPSYNGELAELLLEPVEFWTWGGKYDSATGETI